MKKRKGFKAWLITWEWIGDHAKVDDNVAEILDPRWPPERVRRTVELLYHQNALLREKVAWRLRKQRQVYPAEFTRLEGVQWTGEIHCGHNPWLRARLVDNLTIETDSLGKESASWVDRYTAAETRRKIRRVKSPS